jgi:hypothetical protein
MNKCKNCDSENTIEAHIIPRSFYHLEKPLKIISITGQSEWPKKSPTGIYDHNILCGDCDKILGKLYDEYACKHLISEFDESNYQSQNEIKCTHHVKTSGKIIKNFILSMLWRAHHSTHSFFNGVNLGEKHASSIREIIFNNLETSDQTYQVFLSKYVSNTGFLLQKPNKERFNNLNYYMFFFEYYWATIRIDSQKGTDAFSKYSLSSQRPITILHINFEETKRFRDLVSGIKKSKEVYW